MLYPQLLEAEASLLHVHGWEPGLTWTHHLPGQELLGSCRSSASSCSDWHPSRARGIPALVRCSWIAGAKGWLAVGWLTYLCVTCVRTGECFFTGVQVVMDLNKEWICVGQCVLVHWIYSWKERSLCLWLPELMLIPVKDTSDTILTLLAQILVNVLLTVMYCICFILVLMTSKGPSDKQNWRENNWFYRCVLLNCRNIVIQDHHSSLFHLGLFCFHW